MSSTNVRHAFSDAQSFEEDYQAFLLLPQEIRDWLNYDACFNYSSKQVWMVYLQQARSLSRTLYRLRQIDCAMLRISIVEYTEINIELGLQHGRFII